MKNTQKCADVITHDEFWMKNTQSQKVIQTSTYEDTAEQGKEI